MNDQMKQWGKIRNMFTGWSLEDIYTLRKAIDLKQVDTYWDQTGLFNLARVEMLATQFKYDNLLQKIYQHMLVRVNDRMKLLHDEDRTLTVYDLEHMFKDQPFLYNDNVTVENPRTVLYDVHKCSYKKRLQSKFPKLFDVIEDLVILG